MDMDRISIIVAVYNTEKYLRECLESLINQTYKNLEIIIVDDGSIDNSKEIYDEFSTKDDRIKSYFQNHKGVSVAKKFGVHNATGKWITFVDSDDYVHENYISYMKHLSEEYKSDIVQVDFVKTKNYDQDSFGKISNNSSIISKEELQWNLCGRNKIRSMLCCKLFKRSLFNGVIFPDNLIHEDEATIYQIFENAKKLISNNTILYYYRTNLDSIMRKKVTEKSFDAITVFNEKSEYFKERGEILIFYATLQRASVQIVGLYRKFVQERSLTSQISEKLYREYKKNFEQLRESPLLNKELLDIHKSWLNDLSAGELYSIWDYIRTLDKDMINSIRK